MNEDVVIAIVGYRCAQEIRACLETLARSTHSQFTVHVCENGGRAAYDSLRAVLADMVRPASVPSPASDRIAETQAGQLGGRENGQRVFLHRATGNLGYAGGVNAVLEAIAQDPTWSAMWVLNPDTRVEPGTLGALVARAKSGRYGIIGTRLVLAGTGQVQLYGGRWRPWIARGFNIGLGAPADAEPDVGAIEREQSYVSGASMYVTRSFVERVGPMDERYFLYNEEVDWCFRRGDLALGYAHGAVVHHGHGATMGSSLDRAQRSALSVYLDERNKLLFTRRFFPIRYPLVLVSTLLLTGQYLLAGAYANFGQALAGWAAGFRGEEGIPSRFQAITGAPGGD